MDCVVQYMGGKSYIADWIISIFPKHTCYVEVFGGAGTVLFNKQPSKVEVYNDMWNDIVVFFEVLKNKPTKLQEWLRLTPYSRTLHTKFSEKYKSRTFENDVEQASIVFYLLMSSGNAILGSGFSISKVRNHAQNYKNKVDDLLKFAERLRGTTIENLDFREVIKKYDSEDTLFYCDPPYVLEKENIYYEPKFVYRDFFELAKILDSIEGKAILSCYPYANLKELYPENKWYTAEKSVAKHSTHSSADEDIRGTELLIFNYDLEKSAVQNQKLRLVDIYQ